MVTEALRLNLSPGFMACILQTAGWSEECGSSEAALASDTAVCAPGPGAEALRLHSLPYGQGLHLPLAHATTPAKADRESHPLFPCLACICLHLEGQEAHTVEDGIY